MSTTRARRLRAGIVAAGAALLLVHLLQWLLPNVIDTWNHRIHDRLFRFRAASQTFRPVYDDTVVHVDINQSTLQRLNRRRIDRRHHARAIVNLKSMGTTAQLYDFVFASERSPLEDRELVEAAQAAGNTYFGLVLLLERMRFHKTANASVASARHYLKATGWQIHTAADPNDIPEAVDAIVTFPRLAQVSRGLGSLNLQYDTDGVYRRYPLLHRYQNKFYPSIVLRTVCDYLQVPPERIYWEPGPTLRLASARRPGSQELRDIRIPVDQNGNMIIDFIGNWDRLRHYNFSDILQASDNPAEMALWKNELGGKIVVVSEILSGASDAGPVPTDTHYPLSGVHANALHTILSGTFFRPLPIVSRILLEGVIASLAIAAFVYLPAMGFGAAVLIITAAYSGGAVLAFLHAHRLLDGVLPGGMLMVILVGLLVHRAIESTRLSLEAERERDLVEKELEIGRRIQADFFPAHLPSVQGWQMAAIIRPAKQVAGDFYDIFEINGTRKIALVIGDVCDKGVGAAMFMALFRSLIRALCLQRSAEEPPFPDQDRQWVPNLLQRTIQETNNYIAETHEQACMFATLFFGILDTGTGDLDYVNCGHEPPLLMTPEGRRAHLSPTGPAAGSFPDIPFACRSIHMNPGDLFFACTDGVIEAPDQNNQIFPRSQLDPILRSSHSSLEDKLNAIVDAVDLHSKGKPQFDDITMLSVKRL